MSRLKLAAQVPLSPHAPPLPVPFPASIGLVSRQEINGLKLNILQGSLPDDLHGHAFFIGPGGAIDSPQCGNSGLIHPSHDGTPLFNGDPLVHRLDFVATSEDKKIDVYLRSKIPRTPCFYTDQACLSDSEWQSYGYHNFGLARMSLQLGFRNEVNVAVCPLVFSEEEGHRILLTWDAGRPFEIDPVSLDIVSAIGSNSEWKEQIELKTPFGIVSTAAHPAFAPSDSRTESGSRGQLFTVNYGKSMETILHPVIHGYVDAQYSQIEEDLAARITRYLGITESLVTRLRSVLRLLRWLEKILPKVLVRAGKQATLALLGSSRELLRRRQSAPLELTTSALLAELADLLYVLVSKEIDLNNNSLGSDLDHSLDELLRLSNELRGMVDAAKHMEDFVRLIQWDGKSMLHHWNVVVAQEDGTEAAPRIGQSMHQIGVTKNFVILMDTVFKLGAEQLLTGSAPKFPELERFIRRLIDFRQGDKTILYVINRSQLDPSTSTVQAKRVVLPRATAHFLVDYEDEYTDGDSKTSSKIVLHCVHNNGWDAAEWVRPYDETPKSPFSKVVGMATGSTDINIMARYEIDGHSCLVLDCKIPENADTDLFWMLALYGSCMPDGVSPPKRITDLFWNGWGSHPDLLTEYVLAANQASEPRYSTIQDAVDVASHGLPATLLHLTTGNMEVCDYYTFPPGTFGNSVQFIPRPNAYPGSKDGYLMCIVNGTDDPTTSEFWLFNAHSLSQGPICRLGHPELKIGLTFHSTWVPKIQTRTATYKVSVREDYENRLKHIEREDELNPLFQKYVYPHFESSV